MDDGLKQRVVGAVIVIALAVIFIPKVLHGPVLQSEPLGTVIPPTPSIADINVNPEYGINAQQIQQQVESVRKRQRADAVEDQQNAVDSAENEAPRLGETNSSAESQIEPEPALSPAPSPASGAPAADVAKSKSPAGAWTIQLASFSEKNNAVALRDKIRKEGKRAYIERHRMSGEFVYRVFVGPDIRRQDAQNTATELKRLFNLEGIIVRYQLG